MKYFADTFYFIAILNPSDRDHRRADAFKPEQSDTLVTSEWVLTELADGLRNIQNRAVFKTIYERLTASPNSEVVPATHELFRAAIDLFNRRPDKEWSLTDCTSFILMREQGISHALTADHHFEQAGFAALLKD